MSKPILYLNTDLEVRAQFDLSPLITSLGSAVHLMYHGSAVGQQLATFELADPAPTAANETILRFCELIEALDAAGRETWENASSRIFDMGFDSGLQPRSFNAPLKPETIQRVATLGAGVTVTIYPI